MFIRHTESMKAFKSSVYSATALGISWISSAGCIWSFRARAPSGLRMEIYYWSQNRASLVSASDVTPTDRWLNIWCIWHKSGNTSGVSKSSSDWLNYTGFPGDVCVAFFNVPPGNKDAVMPNPLTKEESHRVYNIDDKRLSGSNKRWIFKSMWNI